MKEHIEILDVPWFSDEARFYLNAQVNKKNCRYGGSEKPNIYIELEALERLYRSTGLIFLQWRKEVFNNYHSVPAF